MNVKNGLGYALLGLSVIIILWLVFSMIFLITVIFKSNGAMVGMIACFFLFYGGIACAVFAILFIIANWLIKNGKIIFTNRDKAYLSFIRPMKKVFQNISLLCVSLLICFLLFEFIARVFVKPSEKCYGVLFNIELPPFKIKTAGRFLVNYNEWWKGIIIGGKKITKGDLWGVLEENCILGYAPRENATSFNGWWQSNNLGARSRKSISKNILPGMKCIIIFGESLTACSDVPREETWPFFLNNKSKESEFINFGVTGYSMGQCLLRYQILKDKIDYDTILLIFSPRIDLVRDINVLREFLDWENYPVLPRFIVENNKLKLIESPYKTWDDFFKDNKEGCSEILRNHLRAYDRLYLRDLYEPGSWISRSIFYKLLITEFYAFQKKHLIYSLMKPNSEAMIVSRKIFKTINENSKRDGKMFILVLLPDSYKKDVMVYKNNYLFRKEYDEMASSIEKEGITCIDLMKDFVKIDSSQFDVGYDGSHNGPKANKIISELIWKELKELKLLPDV